MPISKIVFLPRFTSEENIMNEFTCIEGKIEEQNIRILFHPETGAILPVSKILFNLIRNYQEEGDFQQILDQNEISREQFNKCLQKIRKSVDRNVPADVFETDQEDFSVLDNLRLNISGICNLKCSYCYAGYGKYNENRNGIMTRWTLTNCLQKLSSIYGRLNKIAFFGGEPLLNQGLIEFTINYMDRINGGSDVSYSMDTNGTVFCDPEILKRIFFFVSVDGMKDYHDRYRRSRNDDPTYDLIKSNLEEIRQIEPGIRYGIQCTITPELMREAYGFTELYQNLYRDFKPVTVSLNPVCRREDFKLDLGDFYKKSMDSLFDDQNKFFFMGDQSMLQWIFLVISGAKVRRICPAGSSSITVAYNGDIYPCHFFMDYKYRLGNVNEHSAAIIKQNLIDFQTTRGRIFRHDDPVCEDCWIRNFCVGCIARFPDFEQKGGEFCAVTRQLFRHLLLKLAYYKSNPYRWKNFIQKIKSRRKYEN